MVDALDGVVERVAVRFGRFDVTVVQRVVTRELINTLLEEHRFTGSFDLLSIDVDGVDFWLWEALDIARPRVVVIEYNYLFGPEPAVTIPYDPAFRLSQAATRAYRGASLEAVTRLGRRKGYRLVTTELVNAVFLRDDVRSDVPTLSTAQAYQPPGSHRKDVFEKMRRKRLPIVPVDEDGHPGAPVAGGSVP